MTVTKGSKTVKAFTNKTFGGSGDWEEGKSTRLLLVFNAMNPCTLHKQAALYVSPMEMGEINFNWSRSNVKGGGGGGVGVGE